MDTATFLGTHRVFRLDEAAAALDPAGGRRATLDRLQYAARRGRLKQVARGVYASVPVGVDAGEFWPDRFLVGAALRPDAIFSHHSALELLGAAHSEWEFCTAYSSSRPRRFETDGAELRFLSHPRALLRRNREALGTRAVRWLDRELRLTGPERTLLDGFRSPNLAGGLAELVESAAGFPVLELPLLYTLLEAYGQKLLWGAAGWFLERHRASFFVRDEDLARIEARVPRAPQYLARDQRGGQLVRRWNLIVPQRLMEPGEPDEPGP